MGLGHLENERGSIFGLFRGCWEPEEWATNKFGPRGRPTSATSMSSQGAVEDLVLAPARRPTRTQTLVGPQVPDDGSVARARRPSDV